VEVVEPHSKAARSGNVQPEESYEEIPHEVTKVTGGWYTIDVVPTKIEVKGGTTLTQEAPRRICR
jgi:hypothetical protein